jgi:hypothetical protein
MRFPRRSRCEARAGMGKSCAVQRFAAPSARGEVVMNKAAVKALIGLAVVEAQRKVEAAGMTLRVYQEDGVSFPCTMEFDPNRINVAVEAGRIVSAVHEGEGV